MITVKVWLKSPTGLQTTDYYTFTAEQFAVLQQGFAAFAEGVQSGKKHGVYECTHNRDNTPVRLLISWADVAFIG